MIIAEDGMRVVPRAAFSSEGDGSSNGRTALSC